MEIYELLEQLDSEMQVTGAELGEVIARRPELAPALTEWYERAKKNIISSECVATVARRHGHAFAK